MLQKLFSKPLVLLAVMTVVVLAVGHRAAFVTLDNSPETFYSADAESRETYRQMVDTFGVDEVVMVELRGATHSREEDLLALARLTREIEEVEGVYSALSISKVFDNGSGPLPTALDELMLGDVAVEVAALDVYEEIGLVRPAVPALAVLVSTSVEGPTARVELSDALRRAAERAAGDRLEPVVAGLTLSHSAFDRLTNRSLQLFMPAVVLMAALVGLILFRSPRALVALFLPSLGAVVLGVAGLELTGQSLNLVTAVLPPLVMAIGFASAIHLVTHYGAAVRQGLEPFEAAQKTIRDKFLPTSFAFGTTAIAFGSLALSPVTSIRVLGIAAAGTLLVSLVLVTLGTPAFLLWLRPTLHSPPHRQYLLENLAVWSLRHRWSVLAAGFVLFAGMAAGIPLVSQSINGVRLLTASSPERVSYERLESEGLGLGNFDIWIQSDIRRMDDLLAERERLSRLADRLEAVPRVTGTFSAADLLDVADLRLSRLEARTGSRTEAMATLGRGGVFREILGTTWQRRHGLRVTVLTLTADDPAQGELTREQILAAAREVYPEATMELTGHYSVLMGAPGALMQTLFSSLLVTVGIVALLFLVLLRSWRLVLGGMLANLLPVITVVGVMGWLGIAVNVATVMTCSVIFGVAVDDTFHYLYHRRESGSIRCAAAIAGQGIVATTLVVSAGFATLALSGFSPVLSFGLLVSLGALVALGVDGIVLPAIVGRRSEAEGECRDEPMPAPKVPTARADAL